MDQYLAVKEYPNCCCPQTYGLLWLKSEKPMGLKTGLGFPFRYTTSVLNTPFFGFRNALPLLEVLTR